MWHKHIDYIKTKAWARINIMRKLKFQLDRRSLEIIYTTFIRPILEYGNEIWDNCTQYEKEEIDKIQNEAARIATGTTKLISIETLYSEIGWETLDSRRRKQTLSLFYKMYSNISPSYLSFLVPPSISDISSYNLGITCKLLKHEHVNIIILFSLLWLGNGMVCRKKQKTPVQLVSSNHALTKT